MNNQTWIDAHRTSDRLTFDCRTPTWIDAECLPTDCPTELLQWVQDLMYGGCASGQYMPAVTYHLARATMAEHGDDVLDFIEDRLGGADLASPQGMSWGAYCCYLVSIAVELWASEIEDELEHGYYADEIWAEEAMSDDREVEKAQPSL